MESWPCRNLLMLGLVNIPETGPQRALHGEGLDTATVTATYLLPAKRGSIQPCQLHSSRWHALCTPAPPTNKRCQPYTAQSAALPAW